MIFLYSATQTSSAAYIIGGQYTKDVVAEYKDGQWRQRGSLYKGRRLSGAITIGGQTMIIGGHDSSDQNIYASMPTEIWEFDNGVNNIIKTNLPHHDYIFGIALFKVDTNFCKKNKGKSSLLRTPFGFDKRRYLPV